MERSGDFYNGDAGIFVALDSYQDYTAHLVSCEPDPKTQRDVERKLLAAGKEFELEGYCRICGAQRSFHVDYQYAYPVEGVLTPNWRERLICSGCGLNNRVRAAIHTFLVNCRPERSGRIYITEQTTPLYRWLSGRFSEIIGSEYLGGQVPLGTLDSRGLRNEDFTKLSFRDGTFDFIMSFDVLEHVPSYRKALSEARRCLRPGGIFLFSAPFRPDSAENIIRARLNEAGDVTHLLPPEYHGDPINESGCLSYYQFGWQLLDDLRSVGFENVKAHLYWSRKFCYLGQDQIIFQGAVPGTATGSNLSTGVS